MNYTLHYNKLIHRAQTRSKPQTYTEVHHIIPRCVGGTDKPENLVALLPEEHLLAHLLLIKIYPNNFSLLCAANIMAHSGGNRNQSRISNKQYGWLRRQFAKSLSSRVRGKNNPQYGKSMSEETRRKISDAKRGKNCGADNPMYGKTHTIEARQKISKASKGKLCGEKNGMFGKSRPDVRARNIAQRLQWKITNIITGMVWIVPDLAVFCNEHRLNKQSLYAIAIRRRDNPSYNYTLKKEWICEYYTAPVVDSDGNAV